MVGAYAQGTGSDNGTFSIANLVNQMRKNFIDQNIEIMPGLLFNQYRTIQRIHYYINSQFESGPKDEKGNDKFFHNIINHRNAHATKNIDLDTKDLRVKTKQENKYWFSWIMRMEVGEWMKESYFSKHLNQLSEDLPRFGSVVWKKVKVKNPVTGQVYTSVCNVDLRNLIVDQQANTLRDSQVVAERIVMTASQVQRMADEGGWDKEKVNELLQQQALNVRKKAYVESTNVANSGDYSVTDVLPSFDIYEVWGWVPRSYLPADLQKASRDEGDDSQVNVTEEPSNHTPSSSDQVYVMAILGGLESGGGAKLLFCEEASEADFPYKEAHMRKIEGRWLGFGNTELLFDLQARMNELVNRFFGALRIGSIHLYQTRGKTEHQNLLSDAEDGDIIRSTHSIDPIATDLRAFNQYETEIKNIDYLADLICNTPEVVTGESMPAATPFRLGAQLGVNAAKFFEFIRENCGIFISEVMYEWIVPDLLDTLSEEHVIDLIGSTEELQVFFDAYRKSLLYNQMKEYILKVGYLPSPEDMKLVDSLIGDQMKEGTKKIKVDQGFINEDDYDYCQFYFIDPTGESEDTGAFIETASNLMQIIASNPAILENPDTRKLLGWIMEAQGISPLRLSSFVAKPANPQAASQDAASPASQKYASNPGDAGAGVPGGGGLTPESVGKQLETAAK